MPNYQMARKGTHYTEPAVGQFPALSFSWGINEEKSEVVEVPEERVFGRFGAHINAGRVVKTDRKATRQVNNLDNGPERRLLTGKEARDWKAIPAGPVFRWALDPKSGERIKIRIKMPGQNVPISEDLATRPVPPASPASGTPYIPSLEEVMAQGYDEAAAQSIIDRETAIANGETPEPQEPLTGDTTVEGDTTPPLTGDTTVETTSPDGSDDDGSADSSPDGSVAPPSEPSDASEDTRTKAELQAAAKSAGLPTSGNRAELIARLEAAK